MTRQVLDQLLGARRPDHSSAIAKAAWVSVLRACKNYDEAARIEAADPVARAIVDPHAVTKADATIGTTTDHAALLQTAVGAYFSTLAPLSAGARLIAASTNVPLAPRTTISFPRSTDAPAAADWIGEGDAIPLWEGDLSADALGPMKKFGTMAVVTRELAKRSAGLAVFQQMLRERAAVSLDAAIFSDDVCDDTRHAGLRAGITPTASYGDPTDDIAGLLGALADKGGSGQAAVICNPWEAAVIAVKLPTLATPVWATRALPRGSLVAVDPTAFAVSFGGVDVETSENGLVHMSTVPLEIVSGTGPTTADPVRSLFQTGSIGVRMLTDIAFLHRGGLISCMENVAWS